MANGISPERLQSLFESIMSQQNEIESLRSKLASLSDTKRSLEAELAVIESGNLLLDNKMLSILGVTTNYISQ